MNSLSKYLVVYKTLGMEYIKMIFLKALLSQFQFYEAKTITYTNKQRIQFIVMGKTPEVDSSML